MLDKIHGLVFVAGASAQVEVTGEFDEGGIGDVLGDVAAGLHGYYVVAPSVHHECWSTDGGEHRPDVDLEIHLQELASRPGAGGEALEATRLLLTAFVVRNPLDEARRDGCVPQFCSAKSSWGVTSSSAPTPAIQAPLRTVVPYLATPGRKSVLDRGRQTSCT